MEFSAALKKGLERMGLKDLKPKQIESIKSFASGRDTFVTLPTGYGKKRAWPRETTDNHCSVAS